MMAARKVAGDDCQWDYEGYYSNDFESEPAEWQSESKGKARRKAKPASRQNQKTNVAARPRFRVVDTCLIVFVLATLLALGGLLIQRYEKLTSANTEVNKLKNDIKVIKDEIETQKIQVEFALDILTAQELAEDKLGMGYPGFDDIVDENTLPEAKPKDLNKDKIDNNGE